MKKYTTLQQLRKMRAECKGMCLKVSRKLPILARILARKGTNTFSVHEIKILRLTARLLDMLVRSDRLNQKAQKSFDQLQRSERKLKRMLTKIRKRGESIPPDIVLPEELR
jgi:hypothetical protein